jgi:hypothetical protein
MITMCTNLNACFQLILMPNPMINGESFYLPLPEVPERPV